MKIRLHFKVCLDISNTGPRPKNWLWAFCSVKNQKTVGASYVILGLNLWTLIVRLWIGNWK